MPAAQTVLLTGANGMLGQEAAPLLRAAGYRVIESTRATLDLQNLAAIEALIACVKPTFVLHCAAYTAVDLAEQEPALAFAINATATDALAKACHAHGAVLLYVSTDYVFDGTATQPYQPQDARHPLGIYAQSKAAGEAAVEQACPQHYILRTSWLYGRGGGNFVDTMIRLAQSQPQLKVVSDQQGCPTWTQDFCLALLALLDEAAPFGIYHLCGGGETTWYGLARETLATLGISTPVQPCSSDAFPRPAPRPRYSVLANGGRLRPWQEGLHAYLAQHAALGAVQPLERGLLV